MNIFINMPLEIEVISPVHIGTGEDYVPTDYFIEKNMMFVIDRDSYIDYLERKGLSKQFEEITRKGILDIRGFIYNNRDENSVLYTVPVCKEVQNKYERNINKTSGSTERGVLNQLQFEKSIRSGYQNKCYIPGSSIKGAFMTAVLNRAGKKDFHDHNFGKIISFSDFNKVRGQSCVKEVKNYKNKRGESTKDSLMQVSEVILPGTVLSGSVNLNLFLNSKLENEYKKITDLNPDNFGQDFFLILNNFFKMDVLEKERNIFDVYNNLNDSIKKEDTLIRIGKHSGAYAMTAHPFQENNIFNTQLCETIKKIIDSNAKESYVREQILKTKAKKVVDELNKLGYEGFKQSLFIKDKNSGRLKFNRKNKMFFGNNQTTVWMVDSKPMGWCRICTANCKTESIRKQSEENENKSTDTATETDLLALVNLFKKQ